MSVKLNRTCRFKPVSRADRLAVGGCQNFLEDAAPAMLADCDLVHAAWRQQFRHEGG